MEIPSGSDFSDAGLVVGEGATGAWDDDLATGYSPGLVVEMNGAQYLYYIGSDGNRASDGGPSHRRVGVATSTDWTNWTKHGSNPLVSYRPNSCPTSNDEEGFFSVTGGVYHGTLYMYGGGMTDNGCSGSVSADPHLWTSTDGLNFSYQGKAVDIDTDEAYPVAVWRDDGGTWHLYYVDVAGGEGDIGYASGSDPANLTDQGRIASGNWTGGGAAFKKSDTELVVAIMTSIATDDFDVFTPPQSNPGTLGTEDERWDLPNLQNATAYLDRANNLWRVFHASGDWSQIRQQTAPVRYR